MPLSKLILSYLLTTVVFLFIDLLWLGIIVKSFYGRHLANFLAPQVNWTAAIIFYVIFIVGIFIFGIMPAVEKQSWTQALILGGLFGFFTYATYDLTNLATLNDDHKQQNLKTTTITKTTTQPGDFYCCEGCRYF